MSGQRPRRPPVRVAATALLAAGLLAGCGGSHSHGASSPPSTGATTPATTTATTPGGSTAPLSISPSRPRTGSEITFGFTAPVASGTHGRYEIGYSLSVTGPDHPGCIGAHEASAPSVARGARATITLGPAQLGSPWCAGGYTARAIELRSAHCVGSRPCPQFIAVVGIVARASYSVKSG
jgi:hypothetical protein